MDRNAPVTIPELGLLDFIGFKEVRQYKIYHYARVKLRLFRVYVVSLTMSSQEPPKKNPNEITDYFVCTANAHAWMSCTLCQYAPARTKWKNTRLIMGLNHK